MDFNIVSVFKRSVTVEMLNSGIVYADQNYRLYLNDQAIASDGRNVVSIHGLQPDTEYTVSVETEKEKKTVIFRTEKESVLLDVTAFGAAGDGETDDTGAIQAAILACPAQGTVRVPSGVYRIRPVFVKSNMTLQLEKGAVLLGDPDRKHYPLLPGMTPGSNGEDEYNLATWEGNPETSFASLITGIEIHDFDLVGEGTVDGDAQHGDWWIDAKKMRIAWRPNLIFLVRCSNIRFQSITVKNSPSWTVHPYYTDHIKVLNMTIWNPSDSPNTDGFDPESCDDILILGATISVGDDCIAIKSGKYYMSDRHHKTADHFTIRNSILERGHGSVTVGSEAAGGCQNVEVDRCIFDSTDRGLRIKTRRGRGPKALYDSIYFHDIIMKKVHMPFTLNMFYFCDPDGHSDYVQNQSFHPVDEKTPEIGTVRAENIRCEDADACVLVAYGLPEMFIDRIILKNVTASFLPKKERSPKSTIMMDNFPEMTGKSIYARNVKCLELENVAISGADDDGPELIDVLDYSSRNVVYYL